MIDLFSLAALLLNWISAGLLIIGALGLVVFLIVGIILSFTP